MRYDRKVLKYKAKVKMREADLEPLKVSIFFSLLALVLLMMIVVDALGLWEIFKQFIDGKSVEISWVLPCVQIVVGVPIIILIYGFLAYCLNVYRGEPTTWGNVFAGFRKPIKVIGSFLMVMILNFIWNVIPTIVLLAAFVLVILLDVNIVIPIVAISVLYAAWVIRVFLGYVMTPFIIMEEDDIGILDAIYVSKHIMQGNIVKMFTLQASFLGWVLLSLLFETGIFVGIVRVGMSRLHIGTMQMGAFGFDMMPYLVMGALLSGCVGLGFFAWVNVYMTTSCAGLYCVISGSEEDNFGGELPTYEETPSFFGRLREQYAQQYDVQFSQQHEQVRSRLYNSPKSFIGRALVEKSFIENVLMEEAFDKIFGEKTSDKPYMDDRVTVVTKSK